MAEIRIHQADLNMNIGFENDEAMLGTVRHLLERMPDGGAWIFDVAADQPNQMIWVPNTAVVRVVFDDTTLFDLLLEEFVDGSENSGGAD